MGRFKPVRNWNSTVCAGIVSLHSDCPARAGIRLAACAARRQSAHAQIVISRWPARSPLAAQRSDALAPSRPGPATSQPTRRRFGGGDDGDGVCPAARPGRVCDHLTCASCSPTTMPCSATGCAACSKRGESRSIGEARTGREAVEQTRRLTPDIVLMDLHMPDARRSGRDPADQRPADRRQSGHPDRLGGRRPPVRGDQERRPGLPVQEPGGRRAVPAARRGRPR